MVLNEILQAAVNAKDEHIQYDVSEHMRRELIKTVPEVSWRDYDSEAYNLVRMIGQNMKWKLHYDGTKFYDMILDSVRITSN